MNYKLKIPAKRVYRSILREVVSPAKVQIKIFIFQIFVCKTEPLFHDVYVMLSMYVQKRIKVLLLLLCCCS